MIREKLAGVLYPNLALALVAGGILLARLLSGEGATRPDAHEPVAGMASGPALPREVDGQNAWVERCGTHAGGVPDPHCMGCIASGAAGWDR